MRARTHDLFLLVAAAHCLVVFPRRGEAATQVNGSTFVEDATASRPGDASNVFQTGVNLDVVPPEKRKLKANLNLKFNYVRSDGDELANFSPLGNIALDLAGEVYSLSAQRSQYATVSTAAQLTDTTVSRASFSLVPKDLPRLSASLSRTESQIGTAPESTSDTGSVSANYQYRWVQLRAGYSADRRESGSQPSNESSSLFGGVGASYEVLPATLLAGDVDVSRFEASSAAGSRSSTQTAALRLNADSRPLTWLGLQGNFSRTSTEFDSRGAVLPRTTQQLVDATAAVLPHPSLRLAVTVGNRRFNDVQSARSVDFRTVSAAFSRELRERILFGATASRNLESDPGQGENVTDNFGLNATADVTSRIALRVNTSVSHSENRTFVSSLRFNASGTLADRDRLDADSGGLPAGFTFFDSVHNDLYTKTSSAIGAWALTLHIDPMVGHFSVNRSIQVNATPTDRVTVTLTYASNSSADDLDLGRLGNQSVNGSLSYFATRRSNLGLSGTASMPERGATAYSTTGSYSYRFARGHQMSLSYGRQATAARLNDTFSASLRLGLRKRVSLEATYLSAQLFRGEQTHFARIRLSQSF